MTDAPSPLREHLGPAAPYARALVVANPVSGRCKGESAAREVCEGLRRMGVATGIHMTSGAGDARERVRRLETETELVVSVGGDGTLGEVLSGLWEATEAGRARVKIGVLPLGTGNALSLDLDLPRDVDRALEVYAGARTVALDVARVNGRLSFLVIGVGPDAAVVERVHLARAGPISQWAYLPAALRVLARLDPARLEVDLDGERLSGLYGQVLVSNMIHYGGLVRLSPERVLGDGRFEVFLFRRGDRAGLVGYVLRGLLHRLPGGTCEMRRARRVRITSERPVPYQVDGDPAGTTPVEIEVTDQRFQLLVP